jgi:hypothetical protein
LYKVNRYVLKNENVPTPYFLKMISPMQGMYAPWLICGVSCEPKEMNVVFLDIDNKLLKNKS